LVVVTELPIACSLDGRALAARTSDLRGSVLAEASTVERLPDGYRWRFAAAENVLARIGEVIDAERHCCRFLRVQVLAEADGGAVTVDVTGPPGTVEFLESWLPSSR
jgi:hypothetical protein